MGNLGGDRTTPAAKLRTAEREHQVVELRLRGLRWRPISEATGISIRGCYTAWQRALDHIRLPGAEEAKKQLLEAARLLESNLWTDYNRASEPTARAAIGNAIDRPLKLTNALWPYSASTREGRRRIDRRTLNHSGEPIEVGAAVEDAGVVQAQALNRRILPRHALAVVNEFAEALLEVAQRDGLREGADGPPHRCPHRCME